MIRIGIDVGGTKIAGIAMNATDVVVSQMRVSTPRDDYQAGVTAICKMVRGLATESGNDNFTVGIGIPGSLTTVSGKVQNANSTWINGRYFKKDIEMLLGQQVRMANDANCLALSESHDGAGHGNQTVFGVILGTGCGGALVISDQLVQGRNSITGEWGHTSLPWAKQSEHPGPLCWCGRNGCMETWVSGPALARDYFDVSGLSSSPENISKAAITGEVEALECLDRHLDRCARGLAQVANILDPDIFVIGGGLVDLPFLVERLPQAMAPYVFADEVDIKVVAARHGPASGARGAARLWSNFKIKG
ncbi:MAG: ROK family protein [Anderseniella sp.]